MKKESRDDSQSCTLDSFFAIFLTLEPDILLFRYFFEKL
ncbi:hypothetical protein RV18_GL003641 [Enterococcus termitis]|nr:hypothetical protein RV18_GL003641 [Enterococcus termitis]